VSAAILPLDFLPWGLVLIALGLYLAGVLALLAAGRRTDARALAGFVPDCAVMIRRLLADPATSRGQRLAMLALVAYLLTPIDVVPDFIPLAGQLDDAILVGLALGWLLRTHGEDAIRDAWPGPESSLRVVLAAGGGRRGAATL
jgi:uncharacterized membrane protein YkvA (DUF1232 family)